MNITDLRVRVSETQGQTQFESLVLKQYENIPLAKCDIVLTVAGWVGSSAPYTQTVSAQGVTATSEGVISLSQNATQEQYNIASKARLRCTSQTANQITITCYGQKPTVDLPYHITGIYTPSN